MILTTERLTLRPLALGDAGEVHALRGDEAVMAFWDSPPVADRASADAILARHMDDVARGEAVYWAIVRKADGDFVGICDISEIHRRHRRAEVGYMLGQRFWGAGYGGEAMAAVVGQAAPALGLKRLSAHVHAGNAASIALLRRLGFHLEGVLRGHVLRDGERRDCPTFGLLL